MWREDFEKIPDLNGSRYGVEQRMVVYFKKHKLSRKAVVLDGVNSPLKSSKWGFWRGWYKDIIEADLGFVKEWIRRRLL
jgi:hypothetical protein